MVWFSICEAVASVEKTHRKQVNDQDGFRGAFWFCPFFQHVAVGRRELSKAAHCSGFARE